MRLIIYSDVTNVLHEKTTMNKQISIGTCNSTIKFMKNEKNDLHVVFIRHLTSSAILELLQRKWKESRIISHFSLGFYAVINHFILTVIHLAWAASWVISSRMLRRKRENRCFFFINAIPKESHKNFDSKLFHVIRAISKESH